MATASPLNINIGIMGHVDSGKTSLVKTLSTLLSTAALDKHKQSQERGITLDLGFSSFSTDIPPHLKNVASSLQFTLVDCPGHASLIRTIIGGAQIIDMMILVVDITKGIQTQTAECIVIGEICSAPEDVLIVLNKVDLIDEKVRTEKIQKIKAQLSKIFARTIFRDAPMIEVSAKVGGEKVAAIGGSKSNKQDETSNNNDGEPPQQPPSATPTPKSETIGIDNLVETLRSRVRVPKRNPAGQMLFAIDHCFTIKGKGTILTGTVLSGKLQINDTIEIASLRVEKKIKSMQMFRKPVQTAVQGDRVGMCVAGLDAALIERGLATTPGTVPTVHACIAYVRKIKFFKGICKSKSKIHVTAGHSTVMATVQFFGWEEAQKQAAAAAAAAAAEASNGETKGNNSDSKGSSALPRNWSPSEFDASSDYCHQEALVTPKEGAKLGQYALLEFDTPLITPIGSIIIASRLDADTSTNACRLVFHGKILNSIDKGDSNVNTGAKVVGAPLQVLGGGEYHHPHEFIHIYKNKERSGTIMRIKSSTDVIIIGMFAKDSDLTRFLGMNVIFECKDGSSVQGRIEGKFGSSGKLVVGVPDSSKLTKGQKCFMRFKKYIFDADKKMMHQKNR
jgi:selenocysteine-specific elongation factor